MESRHRLAELMNTVLARVILFVLAIPALLCGFVGFLPYDDEGLFLYMAAATSRGVLPYRDYLLEYGPFFSWFNSAYFLFRAPLHAASREAILLLALLAAMISFQVGRKLFHSQVLSGAAALAWLYLSSAYFSESLHPGWYIAVLQVAQALVLLYRPSRNNLIVSGAITALILGLKLHLGIFVAIAVFGFYCLVSGKKWLSVFAAVSALIASVALLAPMLTHYGWSSDSILALYPFIATSGLLCSLLLKQAKPAANIEIRWFVFTTTLGAVLTYSIAVLLYGWKSLFTSLIVQPKLHYYVIHATPFRFQAEEHTLLGVAILVLLFSYTMTKFSLVFRAVATALLAILCAGGAPGSVLAWPLVFILYAFNNRTLDDTRRGLLILCLAHFVHAFPVPQAQVYYATPLAWILLLEMLHNELLGICKKYFIPSRMALASCAVVLLPVSRPVLWKLPQLGTKVVGCENELPSRVTIDPEYGAELCKLVDYIKEHSSETDLVGTIPGFMSLNLLVSRNSPADLPAARWSYLPPDYLQRVIDALAATRFVVIQISNGRLYLEKPSEKRTALDSRYYDTVIREYRPINSKNWLGAESKHFILLERP